MAQEVRESPARPEHVKMPARSTAQSAMTPINGEQGRYVKSGKCCKFDK